MGKGLKGFRDYMDYLTYAEIYLFWMDGNEHKKTYNMLMKRQGDIEPIRYMRKMSLAAHSQN
ncbi:MAG TPA: hypothetical protein PK842_11095 [Smithella sp.]|jgi:hypothetical protein|nr:hypothetical protein [Smithella sp.]NMC96224.1 hypothetical protein [Deltaproteobacteria bacterium]HOG10381.1 hypothetical protein [Smithella sp.]HOO36184.1 hypothetical protein [Smithella sp.]HOS14724.1 hypothetical protein [Smithella sp.]